MIGNINNFQLYSQTLSDAATILIFEFDRPSGEFGAYILYASFDNISYSEVRLRIDYEHYKEEEDDGTVGFTTESGTKVYFEHTLTSGITDGRILYYKLQAISQSNELSNFSDIIQVNSAPTQPSNVLLTYDGYEIQLSWDALSTSTGRNALFEYFIIKRKQVTELAITTFDKTNSIIYNASLAVDQNVWIIDVFKRSIWFGTVSTEGQIELTDSINLTLASDNSEKYAPIKDNLRILIENNSTEETVGTSLSNTYTDTTFTIGNYYVYSVSSYGTGDQTSYPSKFPIYVIDVTDTYPYLRSPDNSNNTILQSPYWRYLKEVLIDQNYYDKTQFAIPYFVHEAYNLKGYLGVSNCKLDVYINNIYNHTTSTGDYGEFDLNFAFKKGETLVTFQARDKFNIKFSRKSAPYSIRTINIYTLFAGLGLQYKDIINKIVELRDIVSISEVPYSTFSEVYAPLIEFYKSGTEDDTVFSNLATTIFQSFDYASYDKSLVDILNVFRDNIANFDHYEIYDNNNIYNTHSYGRAFVYRSSTGLERGDYYYGIASYNTSTGAETSPSIIRVDRRWWPNDYKSINYIIWDEMHNANQYKIYRGNSEESLYYLTTVPTNYFFDIDQFSVNPTIIPRVYNYTNLYKPTNLRIDNATYVTKVIEKLKKIYGMIIILYGRDDTEIDNLNLTRIKIYLNKVIPPEIKYQIIFAKDSTTNFLEVNP